MDKSLKRGTICVRRPLQPDYKNPVEHGSTIFNWLAHYLAYCALFTVSFALLSTAAYPQDKVKTTSHSPHRHSHAAQRKNAQSALRAAQRKKTEIDLDRLGTDGLRGPDGGKVAVSYEFCIPDTPCCRAEVKRLDATVKFMPGSAGHIGAQKGQCLCVGNTHQPHWRTVLSHLAALPYVRRIIEAYFE